MATTTLSTKGQVILPAELRRRRGWAAGMRLAVVETPEGVLLKPEPVYPPTRLEDVAGVLYREGPPISIEEMDAAIVREIRRRHGRG